MFQTQILRSQYTSLSGRITVRYEEESLGNVLADLEKKADIHFSYSSKKIPVNEKITVRYENVSLYNILQELFNPLPVKYELIDDYVVLKKGPVIADAASEEKEKKVSLNGYIKDRKTGEVLIGAAIYIRELELGAITNNYGYFSLTLPPGRYSLVLSYIGYEDIEKEIELSTNVKFDFRMESSPQELGEVTISAVRKEEMIFKMKASQSAIVPSFVKYQPSLMGESDVIKTLEFQPGITFYGDGSSYFHVRGGNYDQNLILLDDATVYNPSHLLGIFTPIIPEAVKSVDIYKADFPIQYGGRLSSVVDIRTNDGNRNQFSGSASIGIISARASLEGPFKKGASSFFFSARRSYFDLYLKPSQENLLNLYFYDFTTKVNLRLGKKDRLFVTFYNGQDNYRNKGESADTSGINWGNTTATIRWNHIFGSRVFMNTTVYSSKYDYYLHSSIQKGEYWNSEISNASLKEELTFYATPAMKWHYGIKLGVYRFNPGNYYSFYQLDEYQVSPVNSGEVVLYTGAEHEVLSWLKLNYGLRFTSWSNYGESFVVYFNDDYVQDSITNYEKGERFFNDISIQPRLSASIRTGRYSSIKVSYDRTTQYINLITNSISPFNSLEVWLPAGPNIKPQYADILDVGYVHSFASNRFTLHSDVYYKWLYNQIGYEYHASMLVNPQIEGEIRQGDGWTYGFEIALQKEGKKLNGEIAYTYSRVFMDFKELNNGSVYPASQDRPHVLNMSMTYQLRPRWLLSVNLTQASGAAVTTPTSFYYYRGYQVPVFSERNNDRLPPYTRFDLSTTIRLNKKNRKFNHSLTFALYNMLGRENPFMINFNKTVVDDELLIPADKLDPPDQTSSVRYTFKLLPSFNYQFSF
jgi:hypothetical protein